MFAYLAKNEMDEHVVIQKQDQTSPVVELYNRPSESPPSNKTPTCQRVS